MPQCEIKSLPLVGKGKVRDLYAVDDSQLLMVQSDRISAFDVIMREPIPDKGKVLTRMSLQWMNMLSDSVRTHLIAPPPPLESIAAKDEIELIQGRAIVVRRLKPLPVEAVARGYLIGSGWRDYKKNGEVCGVKLPNGLRLADKLPHPIFTPATKAAPGSHDENISFNEVCKLAGDSVAEKIREATLRLYNRAAAFALQKGIIIADTKFEFAIDKGELILIDEALTPDSSRFWPIESYRPGESPPSFDKQFLRDWLETQEWNKRPPPPPLPTDIINKTAARYREIEKRLCR